MKFPDTIYVTILDDETTNEALIGHQDMDSIEEDEADKVAVYTLVRTGKVRTLKTFE